MQLEAYFDILAPNDIRVKGTRVGIEAILYDHEHLGLSPEEIALRYPTLNLESVYATITYYLHNRVQIDAYMREWQASSRQARAEQNRNPSPAVQRLRERMRERAAQRAGTAQ